MKSVFLGFASVLFLGFASISQAATVDDARALSNGIKHAKSVVDRAIGSGGQVSGTGGFTPAPNDGHVGSDSGSDVWDAADELVTESDFLALPVYQEASNDLFNAGSLADQAIRALSGSNIQEGVYLFAKSCAKMGISRSKVARANLLALEPPQGFLVAFGDDLREVVVELNSLHERCK